MAVGILLGCGSELWINICLSVFFILPGMIHALILIYTVDPYRCRYQFVGGGAVVASPVVGHPVVASPVVATPMMAPPQMVTPVVAGPPVYGYY